MAYLNTEKVQQIFVDNLFDMETNQLWFYQMLGLGKHTPFECIGQIKETRLAFELCYRKGLKGKAMDMYRKHFSNLEVEPILNRYLDVDMSQSGIPSKFGYLIQPQLERATHSGRDYISNFLGLRQQFFKRDAATQRGVYTSS